MIGLLYADRQASVSHLRGQPVVPADVLVEAQHVQRDAQRIVEHVRARVDRAVLQRGRDQARVVGRAHVVDQRAQEVVARLGDGRLVADRPQDHRRAVVVARDLLAELRPRRRQRADVGPGDRPVDRDLRPDQQAQAIRGARHLVAVRVVREADEVAAQLLGQTQQRLRLRARRGAAAAAQRLLVQRDAAQEDRLAVEQDVRPARGDGAKADAILHAIVGGADHDVVEARRLGRPRRQRRAELEAGVSVSVGRGRVARVRLGDLDRDLARARARRRAAPKPRTTGVFSFASWTTRVADEHARRFDQAHARA